jgi:hypothetical protein
MIHAGSVDGGELFSGGLVGLDSLGKELSDISGSLMQAIITA